MRAAVEDVHHRHRQQVGVGAADVAVERQPGRLGRRLGHGQRDAEDRVGAEVGLVGRAVELVHGLVDHALVVGIQALDRRADLAGSPRRRPSARPCRGSGRRRRAARPPRTGRWRHRSGTAARPNVPSSSSTSTSTVGLPRESRISRAPTASMDATCSLPGHWMECAMSRYGTHPIRRPAAGNRCAARGQRRPVVRRWRHDLGDERARHAVRHDVRRTLRRLRPDRRPVLLGDGPRGSSNGLRVRPGEKALDLGSGRGAVTRPLAEDVGPTRPRRRHRRRARDGRRLLREDTAHLPHVHVALGNAADPRPPAAPYDVVASSLVIFFLPDPTAALTPVAGLAA